MMTGMEPAKRIELPRIDNRISFLYTDYCRVGKDDGAIRVETEDGWMNIPTAQIVVLLLGPGTTVTHRMVARMASITRNPVFPTHVGVSPPYPK